MFTPTAKTGDVAAYELARKDLTRSIVARFARGNVRVQSRVYMTAEDLKTAGHKSDEDIAFLRALTRVH
jgi:hypothetical protein